jgi:hypothetical protein
MPQGTAPRARPRPLLLERLENRLYLSTQSERVVKRHLLLATLVTMLTTFVPCVYADLYVSSRNGNSVLRYDEVTGAFLDAFVAPRSGSLSSPLGLLFGPEGNLYVNSFDTNSVMR